MASRFVWTLVLCLGWLAGAATAEVRLEAEDEMALAAAWHVSADAVALARDSGRARVLVLLAGARSTAAGAATTAPGRGPRRDAVLARLAPAEADVRRAYASVDVVALDVTARGLAQLARDPEVLRVDLDPGGHGGLEQARPLSVVDLLQQSGLSGVGVTVAVIDSGIDTDHPELADDLVGEQCFCSDDGSGCCPSGGLTESGPGSAEDDNGHGTHVAGIVSGSGLVAPRGGAPDAEIVAVKVLDENNVFCCGSDVLAALDWVLMNRPDVDIVNLSLGTFTLYDGVCDAATTFTTALAAVTDQLRANGVLVVASSMNGGSGTQMAAPACIASVVSVGAVYDGDVGLVSVFGCTDFTTAADQVPCWSNTNAETTLLAPGGPTHATGLGGVPTAYYGTSQASPLAASCAALLLEVDPTLTPAQLEAALASSLTPVVDAKNGLTFPRLDCAAAFVATLPGDCADGIDNDGDGLTDHPDDPGCRSPGPGPEDPACADGVDNDGDGGTDFDGTPPDPECIGVPWRPAESPGCGLGFELGLLLPVLGSLRRWRRRV